MNQRYSTSTGKGTTGALTAGSAKTIILLNPVTDPGDLTELFVSLGETADQTGIALELVRVTTLGSPAGTTGTIVKDNPDASAANWTALVNLTTEPTTYEVVRNLGYPSVQKGLLGWAYPLGREIKLLGGGARVGLRLINDGASTMTTAMYRGCLAWEL